MMSMRVFVYEYLSTGALRGQPGASSLAREGLAMLTSILADLARLPDIQPVVLLAPELGDRVKAVCPAVGVQPVQLACEEADFRNLARQSSWTLVVAPEFDDLLARRCEWALDEGSRLLGPDPATIRLCADKLRLAEVLDSLHIPTPVTQLVPTNAFSYPLVIKPRFGAGSLATFFVRNSLQEAQAMEAAQAWQQTDLIAQPYIVGTAASITLLAGPTQCVPLVPGYQEITISDVFCYQGGRFPLAASLQPRVLALAQQLLSALPGLRGYFGLDVVVPDDEASPAQLIEINPRFTTSYIGLRQLARTNLLACLLDLMDGRPVQPPLWRDGIQIRFFPDGSVFEASS